MCKVAKAIDTHRDICAAVAIDKASSEYTMGTPSLEVTIKAQGEDRGGIEGGVEERGEVIGLDIFDITVQGMEINWLRRSSSFYL